MIRSRRWIAFRGLVRKEFLQIRADKRMISTLLVAPLIQLVVFSYAANLDVAKANVVILDWDRTPLSRALASAIAASDSLTWVGDVPTQEAAEAAIATGKAEIAVEIPVGYGAALVGRGTSTVQLVVDGSDSTFAQVGITAGTGLVSSIVAQATGVAREGAGAGTPPETPGIDLRTRVLFNPDFRSRIFLVPGVLGTVLMVVTMVASSMAIVKEKELGTLEQLLVTPVSGATIVAGKLVPFGLIGLVDSVLIVAVAHLWFGVPLRGNLALLFANVVPYLLCTLGLGLFISTVSRTQQQAMMTSSFFVMVPMIYLSGFVFAVESMPRLVQPITQVVPLRHFLEIVRGIMLKGATSVELFPHIAALWGLGLLIFLLAVRRFHKRLE